jgi:hypothetical protein
MADVGDRARLLRARADERALHIDAVLVVP